MCFPVKCAKSLRAPILQNICKRLLLKKGDCQHICMRSRSSHRELFLGKGVQKICSKYTGEHPCLGVISIKFPHPPEISRIYVDRQKGGEVLVKSREYQFCLA